MNEHLLEQAKKYLEAAIPDTVAIERKICPDALTLVEISFYTDSLFALMRQMNRTMTTQLLLRRSQSSFSVAIQH